MTTLVTGATGFIGASLVRRLVAGGSAVRVFARPSSDLSPLEGLDVQCAFGDLRDEASVRAAVRDCDRVFHCAAKISVASRGSAVLQELYETNVLGTIHVLRAALEHGVRRVVVTSSQSTIGTSAGEAGTESTPYDPLLPRLPYARTKKAAELEALSAITDGLDVVIAISVTVIGPRDYRPSRIGRVIVDLMRGRMRAYVAGGIESVSTDDIVEGHLLAMERGRKGQRYLFSSGYVSFEDMIEIASKASGSPAPRIRLPAAPLAAVARVAEAVLPADIDRKFTAGAVNLLAARRRVDCTKAIRELGFRPSDPRQAIADACSWFMHRGGLQ